MADDESSGSGFLSKAWKFLAGLLFVGLAVLSIYYWWGAFITLVTGAVGLVLALIGLVFFMLAFTE